MPKVSVIIPNYNHAQFLEQRINSVLSQSYQDFEIIYLDDASADNSNEVFARLCQNTLDRDPRIRAILNSTNSGSPFKQWHKGIQQATGDYIWIAESDDYAAPTLLEKLVHLLDAHPSVGLAYCQSYTIDPEGYVTGTLKGWTDSLCQKRWQNDFMNRGIDECQNYLVLKNTIPNASAVLSRRSLWQTIDLTGESMFLCGDWLTWIQFLLQSDIAFCAEPLNYYRCHAASVRSNSSTNGRAAYERMKIFSYIKAKLEIPHEAANRIQDQLIHDWADLALRRRNGISFKRNLEFYQLARSFDPVVELRFVREIGACALEKIEQKISQKKKRVAINELL